MRLPHAHDGDLERDQTPGFQTQTSRAAASLVCEGAVHPMLNQCPVWTLPRRRVVEMRGGEVGTWTRGEDQRCSKQVNLTLISPSR